MNDPINKIVLLLTLLLSYVGTQAQNNILPAVKAGNEYLKVSSVNSASTLQRGNVSFNINSSSSVSKTYKVNAVNDNGFSVTMTTDKIIDSVYADDTRFYYNSEQPLNANDKLANALNFTIGKPSAFTVLNNGIIAAVDDNAAILDNDTLFSFTGIEKEGIAVGERFNLIADISSYSKLKAGDNWADSVVTEGEKTLTKFWVVASTPEATTLGYSSTIRGGNLNTNTNGSYVIANATGLVAQRVIQSVTVGYQIYDRTVYSSTRRTNITESCYALQ
nr:hypothetical protein [uncultured Mucilaginibacter sp.]